MASLRPRRHDAVHPRVGDRLPHVLVVVHEQPQEDAVDGLPTLLHIPLSEPAFILGVLFILVVFIVRNNKTILFISLGNKSLWILSTFTFLFT